MKADEGNLTYSEVTGHGITVDFDKPWNLKSWFWARYVPCWDVNNIWFTSEWFETMGTKTNPYDYEPISDMRCRYSRSRIIEFGQARAVLHWQYSLCDTLERVFNGNTTADEYFYIYPDGVAVRKLVGWPGNLNNFAGEPLFWEVAECITTNPKGTTPFDNLEQEVATFSNIKGQEYKMRWSSELVEVPLPDHRLDKKALGPSKHIEPLCLKYPDFCEWNEYIISVNLKNRPHPFLIFPKDKKLFPYAPCNAGCKNSDHVHMKMWPGYMAWGQWPIWKKPYKIGWWATETDMMTKATATSTVSIDPWVHPKFDESLTNEEVRKELEQTGELRKKEFWRPDRPSTWIFLTGVAAGTTAYLRTLANSWLNPAKITAKNDIYQGYDHSQRAYLFRAEKNECEFGMEPEERVVNPVIIIENWKEPHIKIKIDEESLDLGKYLWNFEQNRLIVWINEVVRAPITIRVAGL